MEGIELYHSSPLSQGLDSNINTPNYSQLQSGESQHTLYNNTLDMVDNIINNNIATNNSRPNIIRSDNIPTSTTISYNIQTENTTSISTPPNLYPNSPPIRRDIRDPLIACISGLLPPGIDIKYIE